MNEPNPRDADLIRQLGGELAAVRPLGRLDLFLPQIAALMAALVLIRSATGWRSDLADVLLSSAFLWKVALLAVLAGTALGSLGRLARPGRDRAADRWVVPLMQAGLLLILLAGLAATARHGGLVAGEIADGLHCSFWSAIAALPAWCAALVWLRRAAPVHLRLAALSAGLAAAASGALAFVLACPNDAVAHFLVWHVAVLSVVTGVTRWILPPLIRW